MADQQNYANLPCALGNLLPGLAAEVAAVPVSGLALDSRHVQAGDVFLAVQGGQVDGRDYIEDAIARGAVAVIADAPFAGQRFSLPVIEVPDLQRRLSEIAGNFHGHPSRALKLVGVTGTNGKTSCAWTIAQLLELLGQPCGLIGTLGSGRIGRLNSGRNTTPDALSVQSLLRDWADGGARWAAMEVSSHGLAQHRVAALQFTAAVFTNLSQDHLDFHGSMAAYGAEKARLLTWPGLALAVINRDDAFGQQLLAATTAQQVLDYSLEDPAAAVFADQLHCDINGSRARLRTRYGNIQLQSRLLGSFNLANLVAACTVLLGLGIAAADIEAALPKLKPVPGRMECLRSDDGVLVVVDYAHTPDALEKVLAALRPLSSGELHCVFGCGGDRDRSKRPLMGEAAYRGADKVVVTSDNPRSETPEVIIDDICRGISGVQPLIEVDRQRAIERAIAAARSGDIVLVAGKGHETYQEIKRQQLPFSDVQCARLALSARGVAS